jgi:hypothetical protein
LANEEAILPFLKYISSAFIPGLVVAQPRRNGFMRDILCCGLLVGMAARFLYSARWK